MAIDIPATFKQLQGDVIKFVHDSKAWRDQITNDGKTTDPDDLDELKRLEEVENDLIKDVQDPAPKNQVALGEVFMAVEGQLTQTKDLYSVLVGVSQTPVAKTKESAARKSLKLLIKVMNPIRLQLAAKSIVHVSDNLFLDVMKVLIGKTVQNKKSKFPKITNKDYKLTVKLFDGKKLSLDDSALETLTHSWNTVIAGFVQDTSINNVPAFKTINEAEFFLMHGLLEELYILIEDNVRAQA